jgi:[ribosomal protein S18]-alanine N-acetyltransferase
VTIEVFDLDRDLRRVLDIERDSFGRDAWPAGLFREYAAEPRALFLIARAGRTVAGYIIAVSGREHSVEIESLAVHSRYRRLGVASLLFQAVFRRARRRGATCIGLMVRRDNEPAIRFYRRLGFVRTTTVPRYYEDGSAGWRMRLPLQI